MANNTAALKTELVNLLTNTVNLDASTKLDTRNAIVTKFVEEWNARVRQGTVDNATNRTIFAVDKWFQWLSETVKEGKRVTAIQSLPTTTGIE